MNLASSQRHGIEHTIRHRSGGTINVRLTRQDAIEAMCTECAGFGEFHPKDCTAELCPLFPYRGKYNISVMQKKAPGRY